MKYPLALLLAFLLALAPKLAAVQPVFLVEIKGTIFSSLAVSPTGFDLDTTKLNNERIYDEFGVSKQDYALVLDGNSLKVVLRQRDSTGALPDITVLELNLPNGGGDSDKKFLRAAGPITSPAMGNLFEGLEGTALGTITFKGALPDVTLEKLSLKFFGGCRNPNPASSLPAALRFSLKTGKEF